MKPFTFCYGKTYFTLHNINNDFMQYWDLTNQAGERTLVPFIVVEKVFPEWIINMCKIQKLMQ